MINKSKVKQTPIVLGQAARLGLISGFEAQLECFEVKPREILPKSLWWSCLVLELHIPRHGPITPGQEAGLDPAALAGAGSLELPVLPLVPSPSSDSSPPTPGQATSPGLSSGSSSSSWRAPSAGAGRHTLSQQKNLLAAPSLFFPPLKQTSSLQLGVV